MAGAVFDEADQAARLLQQVEDQLRHLQVRALVAGADVVGLARDAFVQQQVQRLAVVFDEQAVAGLLAVAVDRQRQVLQGVGRAERDELLDVLPRPDVVRRPGDDDRQAVRLDVGAALHLAAGLARRVRAARVEEITFERRRVGGQHLAVHLVRRDVQEALQPRVLASRLQQRVGSEDVGLDERARLHQRAVDVRLRREVHDVVGLCQQRGDDGRVADVALHESVSWIVRHLAQVVRVAGVRQLVQVDDARVRPGAQQPQDEVRADEPAAARDQVGATHPASRSGCGRRG